MPLKLNIERLHNELDSLAGNYGKTGQLLALKESDWLNSIAEDFLRRCPIGIVADADLCEDQESCLPPIDAQANNPWCLVEREFEVLERVSNRLSKLLDNISSKATILFKEAIERGKAFDEFPNSLDLTDDTDEAAMRSVYALGYVYLPYYNEPQFTEVEIIVNGDRLANLPASPIPQAENSKPEFMSHMRSKRSTELYMFSKLCHSLTHIATKHIGRNIERPKNEAERTKWLIWKVADKLSSIRDNPKPIPCAHVIPIVQAILRGLEESNDKPSFSPHHGERALRAWKERRNENSLSNSKED